MYSQLVRAAEEYRQRLKDRESRVSRHEQIHICLGNVRLVLALVGAGIVWGNTNFCTQRASFWLAVPLGGGVEPLGWEPVPGKTKVPNRTTAVAPPKAINICGGC